MNSHGLVATILQVTTRLQPAPCNAPYEAKRLKFMPHPMVGKETLTYEAHNMTHII